MFIINANDIFYYAICYLTQNTTSWVDDGEFGSGELSSPTIYATKINVGQSTQHFHFAYQKNGQDIYYRNLSFANNHVTAGNEEIVSSNTGYDINSKPTITATDFLDHGNRIEYPRIAWVGYRNADIDLPCAYTAGETRVLSKFRSPISWSVVSVYGGNVYTVNINKGTDIFDDNFEPYAIGWVEGLNCGFPNKYVKSLHPQQINTLNTTGSELQINNSTDFGNMFANSYSRNNLPYTFNTSQNFNGGLGKIESVEMFLSREGIVTKDNTDFYFALGDITVDGNLVDFVEMPDS